MRPVVAKPVEPEAVMRVRLRLGRIGDARFLGHLEWQNVWVRALRRCGAPISYSQGFHPLPRIDFSSALPSGEESLAEYMDVRLARAVDVAALTAAMRATAPAGFLVLGGAEVPLRAPALMGEVVGWDYELVSGLDPEVVRSAVWSLQEAPRVEVGRKSKSGPITLDVKPMIRRLHVRADGVVELSLGVHENRPGKAREMVGLLGLPATTRVVRTEVLVAGEDGLVSPGLGWSSSELSAPATP